MEVSWVGTFDRDYLYEFAFNPYCLIPKVTFDYLANKTKDICGVQTHSEYYFLKCVTKDNDLNFTFVLKMKSVNLRIMNLFADEDNYLFFRCVTYPTKDGV